jgi:hypothetical protein
VTNRPCGIGFVVDDGGRAAAGFKGTTSDCVCRAVAIATGLPYQDIYDKINMLGKSERKSKNRSSKSSARTGVHKPTTRRLMASLGWTWHPTMGIGTGTKVHLCADELPTGRLVVALSRHITAVIDGTIHDTGDPSRGGTRAVYGYWTQP